MSREFYSQLPHKQQTDITDKRAIAEKQDLCQVRGPTGWDVGAESLSFAPPHLQLIKDSIGVSEATNWSSRGSAESKYRSLRCDIQLLDPASQEYAEISNRVYNSQDRFAQSCTTSYLKQLQCNSS